MQTIQPKHFFGWFRLGFDYLPAGLIGMLFAAIVAIHLSTISTHLNLGALYATRDLYHHYVNPKASEEKLVKVGRLNTLLLLLPLTALATADDEPLPVTEAFQYVVTDNGEALEIDWAIADGIDD